MTDVPSTPYLSMAVSRALGSPGLPSVLSNALRTPQTPTVINPRPSRQCISFSTTILSPMSPTTLPPPSPSQAYWDVSVLDTGRLHIPLFVFVDPLPSPTPADPQPNLKPLVPALSFLLRRSQSTDRTPIIFDLSIPPPAVNLDLAREDANSPLAPPALDRIEQLFAPIHLPTTIPELLLKYNVEEKDIEYVILSHLHWDHIGDPTWFKDAKYIVGNGSKALVEKGYPHDLHSAIKSGILPTDRTTELPSTSAEGWAPLGPFPHAYDLFSDGSLYVIDSPGHLPGHINALVRIAPTPTAPNNWVYLAGDSAHHRRILLGEANIAVVRNEKGEVLGCAHVDKGKAEEHLSRIRELMGMDGVDGVGVKIVLAHDGEWYEENKDKGIFWPGKF